MLGQIANDDDRLREKFETLVVPILGPDRGGELMRQVLALDTLPSVAPITQMLRP